MKTISVIMATFNCEHYIGEAIQSVLDQTYQPYELIIIDDGSTDRTEQIVRQFSTPIPILYHWQPNQWQASAINQGVSMASGDWVAFLDSDDAWYPHKLAVQVSHMESNPEVPFFYAKMDFFSIDDLGQVRWFERKCEPSVLEPLMFHGQPNVRPSTVLLRKEVFLKAGGLNPSLRIGADWELFTRIALTHSILYIDQSLAKQRLHPGQITVNIRIKLEHYRYFHACMWELWRHDPKKQAILVQDTARWHAHWAKYFLVIGDYDAARRCYHQAWTYQPWAWNHLRRWGLCALPGLCTWYRFRKIGR